MKYKSIPGTDLTPSCICLGTADYGSGINKEDSFKILDAFVDRGGNFLDTAHVYGNWIPGERGLSEKVIGLWVKERKNHNDVIIATKGAHPELKAMHIPRLAPEDIITDLDESLLYMGLEYIDFYWLHRDDINRPVDEIIETLNDQKKKGKIRYFGCSNWRVERIKEASEYAKHHGLESFAGSEILWSYATINPGAVGDPTVAAMDDESKKFYTESNMAVMPFTSQARGYFNKLARGDEDKIVDWVKATYQNDENLKRFERAKKLSEELSVPLTAVVLGYLTSHPFPTMPIVGCQSIQQLEDSLSAADIKLSADMLSYLENG